MKAAKSVIRLTGHTQEQKALPKNIPYKINTIKAPKTAIKSILKEARKI